MNTFSESLFRLKGLLLAGAQASLMLTAVPAFHGHAQPAQDVSALEPGRPVEREIAGNEEHSYNVTMAAGQFARVVVRQQGIDVRLQLFEAGDRSSIDVDGEFRPHLDEKLEFVAPASSTYRILLKPKFSSLPAGRYEIRLDEVRDSTEKDRQLDEALRLQTEAWRLRMADRYTEAFPIAQKALRLQEGALGPEHGDLAYTLFVLAVICEFRVDYANAEAFYSRGQAVAEKTLGPDHPLLARILSSSAYHYFRHRGEYGKSEALYMRGLAIREGALGSEHPEVAKSVRDLGFLNLDIGDYARAESFLQRAVSINEKVFGEEHVETALSVTYLGGVQSRKGDYPKAEQLFQRALNYWEKAFGPASGWAAIGLNNLATLYLATGEYDRAEPLFLRALSIDQKGNPPDHPAILTTRHNLASLYYKKGELSKLDSISDGLLPMLEKAMGPNHLVTGMHYQVLARARLARNDRDGAESLLRRSLSILETAAGPNYHVIPEVLLDLASISAARGKIGDAVALQTRARRIIEYNLNINLATGSERQKLAYLAALPEQLDQTISLHARFAGDDRAARELAATSVLMRKGRVQDALSDSVSSLRDRLSEQDKVLLDRLKVISSQLARLVLEGPENVPLADHQKKIKGLEEQREKLESEVSRRSSGFYRTSRSIDLADVRRAIPSDAVLIEFAIYRPFDPRRTAQAYGEPSYIVYVFNSRGEIGWKDLGPARGINEMVTSLRRALRDPKSRDALQLARGLDEKVMRPVRELVGDAGHLLVSPDGDLNLIPFEALVDEKGRNLVENYSITYLTTGRDLVRMKEPRASRNGPAVIANPVFGEQDLGQLLASASRAKSAPASKRRSITNTRGLADTYFAPLSGTALEANSIKSLFPESKLVTGATATETAVKELAAPKVLHIATHGFFLDDGGPGDSQNSTSRGFLAAPTSANPLLRSGLAFAGANTRSGKQDDGILTALEASGLDLWGTKLVVLSACDTGIGEIRNGEGVFGLRRSFALAGAESLLMSLWPISDQVTRELMTKYYQNLKQGMGRGEALRQVQLEMIKRPARRHPFYWASFIQSGEWANLDGKR